MTKAHNKITEIQTLQILQTDTNFIKINEKNILKLKQKRKLEKWKSVQNMNKNIIWIIIYK